MVGRSNGIVCGAGELSSLALLGSTLIPLLGKCSRLLVEITRSARAKDLVGITGVVCLAPKTSLAGSLDLDTPHRVLIWPIGNHLPLLSSTVAKELLVCTRVWFVKLDELGTKVASSRVFDLRKDTDVCFINSLECSILPTLSLTIGRTNVGETANEETVPSFFISATVVL